MYFFKIDPTYHREFTFWRERQDPRDKSHAFLKRVYDEEILPCMNFSNADVRKKMVEALFDFF